MIEHYNWLQIMHIFTIIKVDKHLPIIGYSLMGLRRYSEADI